MTKTYESLNNAGAKTAPADQESFIRNFFASVLNYIKVEQPFPAVNNIVTDFYIDLYKLQYDYDIFQKTAKTGTTSDVKQYIKSILLFKLTDVRGFKTNCNSDKAIGTVQFDVNQNLIINSFISGQINTGDPEIESVQFSKWNDPDISIDMMDIIKVYQRNRFNADYTCVFTGFITSNQERDQPKIDQVYSYTGGDVSTALRLATVIVSPSLTQLIHKGYLDEKIQKNLMFDNSVLAGQAGLELIQSLITNAWYTFPSASQIGEATKSQVPTGQDITKIEVQKQTGLGILNITTFPKQMKQLQAYGRAWNNNKFTLYSSREKFLFDIIKDVAETTGFEFYALPNGDFYYGIPKWDIDVDGSYYTINEANKNAIQRRFYYSEDGTELGSVDVNWQKNQQDPYIIGADDFVSIEIARTVDNIFTRVDVQPMDFTEDIFNPMVLKSMFQGEGLTYSYPDFSFELGYPQFDPKSEEFKDLVRYGMKPFPVNSKPFLKTPEQTLSYAKHVYNKLKAMRTTATMTILPRPEIMPGRTIRIPHRNIIAYIKTVSHSIVARKSAATVLGLTFVRSAIPYGDVSSQYNSFDPPSSIEKKFGHFVPCSTLNYALQG